MFNELSSEQVKQLNRPVSSLLTLVEKVFFPLCTSSGHLFTFLAWIDQGDLFSIVSSGWQVNQSILCYEDKSWLRQSSGWQTEQAILSNHDGSLLGHSNSWQIIYTSFSY